MKKNELKKKIVETGKKVRTGAKETAKKGSEEAKKIGSSAKETAKEASKAFVNEENKLKKRWK
jgi:hypothetical protein